MRTRRPASRSSAARSRSRSGSSCRTRGPRARSSWGRCGVAQAQLGYNAQTDEYEDLVAAGVIDPTKVTRTALQNAASIAGLLLTTECVVVQKKENGKMPPMPGGGGMGGMY